MRCSPLDYLPTLLFLRRLPHLDAPVMITTSVSNINVSVQLGDTTPFALGFLSANGGTCCHVKSALCSQKCQMQNSYTGIFILTFSFFKDLLIYTHKKNWLRCVEWKLDTYRIFSTVNFSLA